MSFTNREFSWDLLHLNEFWENYVKAYANKGYAYGGAVNVSSPITTSDRKMFYLLTEAGTYANMSSSIVHTSGIGIALWNGSAWSYQNVPSSAVVPTDAIPTEGSTNPVQGAWLYEQYTDLITGDSVFNNAVVSAGGQMTFTPIVLSQDGDELYIKALPIPSKQANGGYPFTFGSTADKIRVGLSYQDLSIRSDDNTWIYGPAGSLGDGTSYNPKEIRIKYTGGNIEVWCMGVLKKTYSGQKTITIYGIGSLGMTSYGQWSGTIWNFDYTHNGTTTSLVDFPNFSANNLVTLSYDTTGGRIPVLEQKVAELESGTMPPFVVESGSNYVCVYTHLHGNLYLWFNINHFIDHSDNSYIDYWRISSTTGSHSTSGFATYEDGTFTPLNKSALYYVENEFAIQFYSNDFTGGAHGNERIDLDNTCYVTFIVDGKEMTISELNELGTISCNSFEYRERSVLYSMYSQTTTHDPLAYHTKRTAFHSGGLTTRNYVQMLTSITAKNAYCGLFCIAKDASSSAINDAGVSFALNHPATTANVDGFSNKADRDVKFIGGDISCVATSRVVGGNVDSYNNAPINVFLTDRVNDAKYYCAVPQNVELTSTSVFEFEGKITFDYYTE